MDLQIKLPHPSDAELVRRCVEFLHSDSLGASVRPLGRYGYTNSRLYLVYCAPRDGGIPFVVKTDRPAVVRREADGVRRLAVYFSGALAARIFPLPASPEAIIYPLVSLDEAETVVELREVVYLPRHARQQDMPSSVELLQRTYESCRSAHVVSPKRIHFGAEYQAYLRESPERLLSDPLPNMFADGAPVRIYDQVLKDPRRILEAVRSQEIDSMACPVHGDLHPNNVLFGVRFTPVLIDYAWGHLNGHFLKDFILMECSLRFLLVPRLLEPNLLARLDDALLDEDGYGAVHAIPATGRMREVLQEVADLVAVIRTQARMRHPSYDFREYLLAQYLILTGALRLFGYQEFRTLRALCRIADKLEYLGVR